MWTQDWNPTQAVLDHMAVLIVPTCFHCGSQNRRVEYCHGPDPALPEKWEMYRCILTRQSNSAWSWSLPRYVQDPAPSSATSKHSRVCFWRVVAPGFSPFLTASKCSFYRNGVLLCILYAFDAADCIKNVLADTLAPECGRFICGIAFCIHTVQRKHSGSAYGNDSYIHSLLLALSTFCKMLGIFLVCVSKLSQHWNIYIPVSELGRSASSQMIRTSISSFQLPLLQNKRFAVSVRNLYSLWITSGKYCNQLCPDY